MLHVVLWKWRQANAREQYRPDYVNNVAAQLRRNLTGLPYRIICITDDPHGLQGLDAVYPLWTDLDDLANASKWDLPSCYRRLKLYDPNTQHYLDMRPGERILGLDVDTAITGPLGPLILGCAKWRYMGWALPGDNGHPKRFNGSFQMFTAGDLSEIWTEFIKDPQRNAKETNKLGWQGSDQSWLSRMLVAKEGCEGLTYPTLASYALNIRKLRMFEASVRIVFFNGAIKPWHEQAQRQSKWLSRYWR